MKLYKTIKRITIPSFFKLVLLSLKNPFFIFPTLKATKQCLAIATAHFGRQHYQNTPANAFRHAFWNYLIAKKCTKWSRSNTSVLTWTKNSTDWHENAFKNRALARKMDLHNNKVGRTLFSEHRKKTIDDVLLILIEMTKKSIRITDGTSLKKHQFSLVHITD